MIIHYFLTNMTRVEITCFDDELDQFKNRTDITSLIIRIKSRTETVFKNLNLDWLKHLVNLEQLVISGFGNITNTEGLLSLTKLIKFCVSETYIGDITTLRNNLDIQIIELYDADVETFGNVYLFCKQDLNHDVDISGLDVCKKIVCFECDYHIKNMSVINSWVELKSIVLKREIKTEDMRIFQSLKHLTEIVVKNSDIDFSGIFFLSLQLLVMNSCKIQKIECLDAPKLELIYINDSKLIDFKGFNYVNHPNIKINILNTNLR